MFYPKAKAMPSPRPPRAVLRGLLGPQAKPRWLRDIDFQIAQGTIMYTGNAIIGLDTAVRTAEYLNTCSPSEQARIIHMIALWRPQSMRMVMSEFTQFRQRQGVNIRRAITWGRAIIMHPENGIIS